MKRWVCCSIQLLCLLVLCFSCRWCCEAQPPPSPPNEEEGSEEVDSTSAVDNLESSSSSSSCPTLIEESSPAATGDPLLAPSPENQEPPLPLPPVLKQEEEQQPEEGGGEENEEELVGFDEAKESIVRKLRSRLSQCSDMACLMKYWRGDVFLQDHWEQAPLWFDVSTFLSGIPGSRLEWNDLVELAEHNFLMWSKGLNFLSSSSGSGRTRTKQLEGQLMTRTTMEQAMRGGGGGAQNTTTTKLSSSANNRMTLTMAHVQSIHPAVAELCLNWQGGLGLGVNINVQATTNNAMSSSSSSPSPLVTTRADILYIQTSGKQRIQVYAPKILFPVWGIHGQAEWGKDPKTTTSQGIPTWILGKPILDTVLRPGLAVYIPRGFPYTTMPSSSSTSTSNINNNKKNNTNNNLYSVGMILELYTEAHHYVYEKIVRCAMAKAGMCEETEDDFDQTSCGAAGQYLIEYARSEKGQDLRRAIPIGFLNPGGFGGGGPINNNDWFSFIRPVADTCSKAMIYMFRKLKPKQSSSSPKTSSVALKKENILKQQHQTLDETISEVARRMFHIQKADLVELTKITAGHPFYNNNNNNNKKHAPNQRQALCRKIFNMIGPFQQNYCHAQGSNRAFQDYFHPDLEPDEFTQALKEALQKQKQKQ